MTGSQTLGHPREILSISVIVDQSEPSLGTTKRLFSEVEYPDTAVYIRDSVLCSWFREKQVSIKINYLYVRTIPLEQKFHADSKYDLKKKVPYNSGRASNLGIKFLRNFPDKTLKSLPKVKTGTEKKYRPLGRWNCQLSMKIAVLILLLYLGG